MSRRDKSITTAAGFARVFAARNTQTCRHLRMHHASSDKGPRLGLAVSRRLTGSAVQRNRVRRRLAEQFRRQLAALPAVDVVVTLRRPCRELDGARQAADDFGQLLDALRDGS